MKAIKGNLNKLEIYVFFLLTTKYRMVGLKKHLSLLSTSVQDVINYVLSEDTYREEINDCDNNEILKECIHLKDLVDMNNKNKKVTDVDTIIVPKILSIIDDKTKEYSKNFDVYHILVFIIFFTLLVMLLYGALTSFSGA
jgi:hypothetical protein